METETTTIMDKMEVARKGTLHVGNTTRRPVLMERTASLNTSAHTVVYLDILS